MRLNDNISINGLASRKARYIALLDGLCIITLIYGGL